MIAEHVLEQSQESRDDTEDKEQGRGLLGLR